MTILGFTHWYFQATLEERAEVRKLIETPWDPNPHINKLFANLKKHLTTLGEMKNAIPYPDEDFIEALYITVKKTKQFTKSCEKWKRKPPVDRSTKAQAREYFKGVYEIFDAQRDSFHEMGVANNVVMQEKMDSLAAENAQMKQEMAANQAKNEKYHHVIDTAMSMTQATADTERDDTTLQTQWSAFTAPQAANTETEFADLQRRLEQCMARGTDTPPPAVVTTSNKDTTRKRRKGPLSDGPKGVTKTENFYKSCDHACWSCGYDVSKHHHSGNCQKKKNGHIDSHTGDEKRSPRPMPEGEQPARVCASCDTIKEEVE